MNNTKIIQCMQCGKCCKADMIAYASESDIKRWEKNGRYDIIEHCLSGDYIWAGDRIISSHGAVLKQCSFLRYNEERYECAIYEDRPQVCRDYQAGSSFICPLYGQ